jgi:hypothetical protein
MSDNGTYDVPRLTLALGGVNKKTAKDSTNVGKNRKGTKVVTCLLGGEGIGGCRVRLREEELLHE